MPRRHATLRVGLLDVAVLQPGLFTGRRPLSAGRRRTGFSAGLGIERAGCATPVNNPGQILRRYWAARVVMGRCGGWMGLEEGQARVWPSSRNPHRCLKAAKRAKTANAFGAFLTYVTLWTLRAGAGRGAAMTLRRWGNRAQELVRGIPHVHRTAGMGDVPNGSLVAQHRGGRN
jgi:hypothetical protein